ncbi:MAG TPA: beta-propeller domain-containing protein, partial [Ornithinibacter sp.]|nr:beta-propeller domain-containing protein [Ornithinibacter sp.]
MNIRTALVSATTLAVVAGAGVGVGVALAGSDGTGPRTPPPGGSGDLVLANADLELATDCDALLDSYVDRGLDRVGPYGWDFGGVVMFDAQAGSEMSAGSPTTSARSSVSTSRSTSNETGTNVQEVGVDESDVVKVAGSLLLRLQDGTLRTYDVSGDEPTELSSTPIPDAQAWPGSPGGELLFVDGRAVVFGTARDGLSSTITTVDLADPTSPSIVHTVTVEGQLSAARLHGDVVRVVIQTGLPELDFRHPTGALGEIGSRLRNRALVRDTTLADWLPTVDGEPIVDCADVAIPTDEDLELGSTTLLALDPADPDARTSTAVATNSPTSYFSTDRFYLAGAAPSFMMWDCFDCRTGPTSGATPIFAFALDGLDATYVASGEVEGTIADRWSMDAVDGSLRVAVGASSETGNFNSVITLREDG